MLRPFKWPIIYVVTTIFTLVFVSFVYVKINGTNNLSDFIMNSQIFMSTFLALIFIPLFIYQYKKLNIKETKINNYLYIILFGICLSILFNSLIYLINNYIHITNLYQVNNRIFIAIITSGIIGPIIEELLFRGILYNSLLQKYKKITSVVITTIVFSFLHFTIIQIIYALIMGLILIYIYEKYRNIKAPIIFHILSNITSIIITFLLINNNLLFNIVLIIISLIVLIIINRKERRK